MDLQLGAIFTFAIIAAIFISLIANTKINKDKKVKTKYDERQKQARGKAYTYGFYTMIISSYALMLAHMFGLGHFIGFYGYIATVILGIIVQMTYAIFKDAYVGMNVNFRKYMIFMSIISLINIAATVAAFINNEMIVDGALQSPFMNLLCSILFAVLVADLGIKKLIDKKED